jgi:DNA/RNA-binding domain of Phe-tRNA-synthetase-like protein
VDAENRVICRLDSLQADFSKVTVDTKRVLLIVESTTAHDAERLESDFATTRAVLDRYCGVTAQVVAFPG